jgi:hypothetical protein
VASLDVVLPSVDAESSVSLTVVFEPPAGADLAPASVRQDLLVRRAEARLAYTGPTAVRALDPVVLSATLTAAGREGAFAPLTDRTLVFRVDGQVVGSPRTDGRGTASLRLDEGLPPALAPSRLTASRWRTPVTA